MTPLNALPDRVILALLIWGEARGESLLGQVAVACVVRNRLKREPTSTRWRDVCLAPFQFSCFNGTDRNGELVARAAEHLMTSLPTPALAQCLWIADGAMTGAALDPTNGATHYLTTTLLNSKPPTWAKDQPVLVTIGAHAFLNVA